jgi:HEPN domain-containing protein
MRLEIERLVKQAEADLASAERNLVEGGYYLASFCGHQAVEKLFKALYLHSLRELYPKIHDLVRLAEELNAPPGVKEAVREINADYAASRYPEAANGVPAEQYDEPKARRHLKWARRAIGWAKSELSESER